MLNKANQLRQTGQNVLASSIYAELLIAEPNNPEVIFNNALNLYDSDPIQSIKYFLKVIELEPTQIFSYLNIAGLYVKTGWLVEAINILNSALIVNPNNGTLIYERAVIIGNMGDNLSALLDFYDVLEKLPLKNNPDLFIQSQLSSDIALTKVRLRNETINKQIILNNEVEHLKNVIMKEYQYPLPAKLFGDELYLLEFGKMIGYSIKEVIDTEPHYIYWCIMNLENFCVSEEIIHILKLTDEEIEKCAPLNSYKLQILENQKPIDVFNDEENDEEYEED